MAAPQRYPAIVSAPRSAQPSALEVQREALTITCEGASPDGAPLCRFEAIYWIFNPTTERQRTVPGFVSELTDDVTIFIDGRRADRELSDAEAKALVPPETMDDGAEQTDEERRARFLERQVRLELLVAAEQGKVRGIELDVAPKAVRKVTAKGRLVPGEAWAPGHYMQYPAGVARHLWLQPENRSGVYELEYRIAPILTWGKAGPIEVLIRYPREWQVSAEGVTAQDRREVSGENMEMRWTMRADQIPSLILGVHLPRNRFHPGGPLIGIGGTFGDAGGFRTRLGWELSAPDWLLYSASMDTNFSDTVVLTPAIEAAAPWVLIIPSFGAGVGMPVRVKPETEVGIRLQLSAAFGPVGFVTSFDMFPGVDSDRADAKQTTMLFLLSL